MRRKQTGFTLVELVIVIAILGILAAFAIPKYAAYIRDARIAALNGLAGAMRSSVAVVQSRYIATGNTAAATVTLADGSTTVAVSTGNNGGIPTAAAGGIDNAVNYDASSFIYDATNTRFTFNPSVTNCWVTYTAATGVASVVSTGC